VVELERQRAACWSEAEQVLLFHSRPLKAQGAGSNSVPARVETKIFVFVFTKICFRFSRKKLSKSYKNYKSFRESLDVEGMQWTNGSG
jgi:hypothetical protein